AHHLPPLHTTFAARGLHAQNLPAHKLRDPRIPSPQAITHVAWSCDGKRLAGIWTPETNMESRAATHFSGGHSDDVDYISWTPTHPELFCTSSQKDRRIVFWDARRKKSAHAANYSPDGRALIFTSARLQLFFFTYRKDGDATKAQWYFSDKDWSIVSSTAMFNHVSDGIILTHHFEHSVQVMDYPTLTLREIPAAHVGGCVAVALDPRGKYLASGGCDSTVNMFDLSKWICARTISTCDFSYDAEYLAIANTGPTYYLYAFNMIWAQEMGAPLHRIPALAPSPTVTWHPSKYDFAYCGQTKLREGAPPVAIISLFGGGI
ncbi:WD40 repeat-like protein, partial [Suillus hirtellus]